MQHDAQAHAAPPSFEFLSSYGASGFAPGGSTETDARANPIKPGAGDVGTPLGSDANERSARSSPEKSGSTSPHTGGGLKPLASHMDLHPAAAASNPLNSTPGGNPNAVPFTPPPPAAAASHPKSVEEMAPPPYNATFAASSASAVSTDPACSPDALSGGGQPSGMPPPPMTRTNVYIAWLPRTFLEHDLLNLVAPFGDIVSVRLVQDASRSYAFVLYESREAAERSLLGLNTTRVNGRRLQARISSTHDGTRGGAGSVAGPRPVMVSATPPYGAAPPAMYAQQHGAAGVFAAAPPPPPPFHQHHQSLYVAAAAPPPQQVMYQQPPPQSQHQQHMQPAQYHQHQQQHPPQQQPVQFMMMPPPHPQQPVYGGGPQQQQQQMVLVQIPGSQMFQAVPVDSLHQHHQQQHHQPQHQPLPQHHFHSTVAQPQQPLSVLDAPGYSAQQHRSQGAPSWVPQ